MAPIADPGWPDNFHAAVMLEVFKDGPFTFAFIVPLSQSSIFYRFRMYLLKDDEPEPLISLNHETSDESFLGMHDEQGHKNLGPVDFNMPFSAFVHWAMETSFEYLAEVEGYKRDADEASN